MKRKQVIAEIELKIAALKAKREALLRKTMATCVHCKRRTQIGKLTYVQTYSYVEPHGCMGGDYWTPTEGRFACPKCDGLNRLYFREDRDGKVVNSTHPQARDLTNLQRYFGSIEDDKRYT